MDEEVHDGPKEEFHCRGAGGDNSLLWDWRSRCLLKGLPIGRKITRIETDERLCPA